MPTRDHKVRVFISSTFKDMHAERDHLVTVVFPELRERCERLGLEFFDVDLRWGVPEKTVDGETANSWEYCRQWIDRVEPFFVCMLGQRYGWEPEPEQLKDADDRARQLEQKRSITDMEVRYAVLNTTLKRHSYFYLRDAEAPATATDFVDPPPLLAKLDELKTDVRACGRPVRDYPCEWKDNAFTRMEEFGKRVLADLWSGVLRDESYVSKDVWRQVLGTDPAADPRYTNEAVPVPDDIAEKLILLAKPPPKDALEAERDEMQRFADSRLRWFQGRTKELEELKQFIATPAEDNQPRLAVIAAVPGQGKSALMAKLWEELRHSSFELRHSTHVVAHFVGATSQSSSSYNLVKRLNDELDASGITFPERSTPEGQPKEEPKLDFQNLCQRLWDRLGDHDGEKRIVILLDALNQLDDGHNLGWLPYRLGPSVRIVVSCIEDPPADSGRPQIDVIDQEEKIRGRPESVAETPSQKVLVALDSRYPKPKRIPLGPLTASDIRTIVTGYLAEYCKELDAPHVDALCALPQARNPLYLLVLLAELRTLGGNDMNQHVPALIADMGTKHPDTVSLFDWVLKRLEQAEGFGKQAVRWWCLYLALGRVGMSSRELSDLLIRKLGPDSAATAQRIERALRRYLQRRGEQWDFFHGQLRQAVMERCIHSGTWPAHSPEQNQEISETIRQAHHDIAACFRRMADPHGDQSWQGGYPRGFAELPSHLAGSEQMDELRTLLSTLVYLAARIVICSARELLDDYVLLGDPLPSELIEWRDFLRKHIQVLTQDPGMLVALANHEGFLSAREQAIRAGWPHPWLKTCAEVMPLSTSQNTTGINVEVLQRMDWAEPRLATFASSRQIAFYQERLGAVRVIDWEKMRELDAIHSIRHERSLFLLCSPDAKAVVSFFESGEADLHRCVLDASGQPVTLEIVTTFRYFLPQLEDPVAVWHQDAFWFQSRPNALAKVEPETGIVTEEPLPPGQYGELAAIVFTHSSRLVALRQDDDAILISESEAVLRCRGTDIYAACACDHESVAIAFTNGDLVAYDLSVGITQRSKARSGVVQGALGWDGKRVWWADNKPGCRIWELGQSDIVNVDDQGEIFPTGLLTSPRAWLQQSTSVALLSTRHGLLSFRLSGEAMSPKKAHGRLDGFWGGDVWRAVWMRDGNHWVAAGCLQSENLLAGNEPGRLCCAVDGRGYLFAVSGSGQGKIIDPSTLHETLMRNCLTLPNMASGDTDRGCWFSDRTGYIYYVDVTGLCRQVAEVGLAFPQGSQLHSFGDYLVWSGLTNHWFSETGQEPAPTLVIFRRKFNPEMLIERLGEHVTHPQKGHCWALCFDAATAGLVSFWIVREGRDGYLLRLGCIEDFVERGDVEERELAGLKMLGQFPKIALSSQGESLAVLGDDGTLSCVDVGTGRVIATLAPSSPLIAVAAGGSTTDFWVTDSQGQVYSCNLVQTI